MHICSGLQVRATEITRVAIRGAADQLIDREAIRASASSAAASLGSIPLAWQACPWLPATWSKLALHGAPLCAAPLSLRAADYSVCSRAFCLGPFGCNLATFRKQCALPLTSVRPRPRVLANLTYPGQNKTGSDRTRSQTSYEI
eukprot:2564825-Prymnesium_polylepis.1